MGRQGNETTSAVKRPANRLEALSSLPITVASRTIARRNQGSETYPGSAQAYGSDIILPSYTMHEKVKFSVFLMFHIGQSYYATPNCYICRQTLKGEIHSLCRLHWLSPYRRCLWFSLCTDVDVDPGLG